MCLFFSLLFFGPRLTIVIYWLARPGRWDAAFSNFIVPFLGFLFFPWTTLCWVLVAPNGVVGVDYLLLFLAIALDIVSFSGGVTSRRRTTTVVYA